MFRDVSADRKVDEKKEITMTVVSVSTPKQRTFTAKANPVEALNVS
jgi:hypothetical protein